MAVSSNLSHFARLDENFLTNKAQTNVNYIGHMHEGWICISSPGSDFCNMSHSHFSNQNVLKGALYTVSTASYFKNKDQDFGFKYFFNDFINTRIDYLDRLKTLGNNWISGKSNEPPAHTIEFSKNLLKKIRTWFSSEKCSMSVPPKILMSPIPRGGISLEIYFYEKVSFLVRILENSIELEKEENGYYSEIKVTEDTVFDEITGGFNTHDFI